MSNPLYEYKREEREAERLRTQSRFDASAIAAVEPRPRPADKPAPKKREPFPSQVVWAVSQRQSPEANEAHDDRPRQASARDIGAMDEGRPLEARTDTNSTIRELFAPQRTVRFPFRLSS